MNQDTDGGGWCSILLFLCIAVTIGSVLPVGYCFGVMNAPAEFIKTWAAESFNTHYSTQLSDGQTTLLWAIIVSVFQIGGIIGSLCAASLNTRFGRRGTLRITDFIFTMSFLLFLLCRYIVKSVEMLLLGRLLGGVASALVYSTQPMYLVELAPPELSGSVGVFTCIGITGGVVVGQLLSFDFVWGTKEHWHWALSAFIIFVWIGSLCSCFYPESPRFLVAKGRKEEAKMVLQHLRGLDQRAEKELAQIEAAAHGAEPSMSIKDVVCNGKLQMAIILVCSFHFVQQGSGINAIWFYSVATFTDAGFSTSVALWLNFALGVLNFLAALCGVVLMAKFDRRLMMMLSCILSSLFMLLLSFGLHFADVFKWLAYFCIILLALYMLSFNMALGPMPYFIGSELFVISPRAAVMALGSLSNWIMNFVIGMIFPILSDSIGSFAFLVFAVICVYGFLLTYRYLPETRNRTPEDVAPLMENGFKSKIK
ncbi:solute carrier family 2, facilitated glucose transporter member 3 [Drosophila albomicans]|uniref:Solute carrier family 2, facilitated glucose transporter member 3 n=1 Tax=Drosophila albomicans TaxID=7291 RepID=A0A6P8XFK3_DROAB|nr:solute carrier family 2, facilitated glucose transporter member 3 [Drosophila albomicans]